MTASKILYKYKELLDNALKICKARGAHFYNYDEIYILEVEGDIATISYPQVESSYDCASLTWEKCSIPSHLLDLPLDAAISWARNELARERREQKAEEDRRRAAYQQQQETERWNVYVQLKEHFKGREP